MNAGARQRRHDRSYLPAPSRPSPHDSAPSLAELVADMNAGAVTAAGDPRRQPGLHRAGRPGVRRGAAARCRLRVHLGPLPRRDRRAVPLARSGGALPRSVERRARASTAPCRIVQPLIAPLYGGRSVARAARRRSRDSPDRNGLRHRAARSGRRGTRARRDAAPATSRSAGAARCTTAHRAARRVGARSDGRRRQCRCLATRPRQRRRPRRRLEVIFRPTRRSTTAASRTTAGCRSCRSR